MQHFIVQIRYIAVEFHNSVGEADDPPTHFSGNLPGGC